MSARRKKRWSFSVGVYGCSVRAYERADGGNLWLEIRERGHKPRYENLEHRDRGQATEQAKARHSELARGLAAAPETPTLGVVLDAFLARQEARAAELRPAAVADAKRESAFWKAALGEGADPTRVTQDDLEGIMRLRRSGAIDARGGHVAAEKRCAVRVRAVASDLEFLRAALRWAVHKKRLLRVNVMDGFEIPDEPNPRRPVATADRYERSRAKADQVTMELRGEGKRVEVPSYLPELLDLAYATGRRIGAICALRYADLRLDVTAEAPYGATVWPAATDKMGKEWMAPIDRRAREALDRIGADREVGVRGKWPASPWLFPSPRNPSRPLSKDLASEWLERAEALAELPKLDGSLWHAYRRGWATARKHYPLADVAAAGGWKDTTTLRTVYTQADAATVRRVVLEPIELREGTN
jgi:integrase